MYANSFAETILELWRSYPFHIVAAAFMLKFLSILLYASLLFLGTTGIKKLLTKCGVTIGVRANYYCWYTLLLAVPLSYLDFNSAIKVPVYEIFTSSSFGIGEPVWWVVTLLTLAWILVLLYRVEAFIIQNAKLEGTVRLMKPADAHDALEKAAAAFGLSAKKLRVVEAEWVSSPLTYGVFKKTILLPRGFEEKYSEEELHLLLLHEMAHIKNGDMAKFYCIRLLNCLFLIPPGFLKAFKRDSEILCDNRVLGATTAGAESYGKLLVQVCAQEAAPIKGLAFSDSFKSLKSRVLAIQHVKPVRHRLSVFAIAMVLCFAGAFVWARNVPAKWYRDSHPGNLDIEAFIIFAEDGVVSYSEEDKLLRDMDGNVLSMENRPTTADLLPVFYYSDDGYRLYYDYDALEAVYDDLVAAGRTPAYLSVNIKGSTTAIGFPPFEEVRNNPGRRMVFPANPQQEYIERYIAHWL